MSILKIWITNYDSTGSEPVLKYRIALVDAVNKTISDAGNPAETTISDQTTGNPGYEIQGDGEVQSPADAVELMTDASATGSNFTINGQITGIVIDTSTKTGNGGSQEFAIYHGDDGTPYNSLYMSFSLFSMSRPGNPGSSIENTTYMAIGGLTGTGAYISDLYYNSSNVIDSDPQFYGSINDGDYTSNFLKKNFMIYFENGHTRDLVIAFSTTNCLASWTPIPKIVPVSTLQIGDIIRTNVGDQPISKIMKTNLIKGDKNDYIVFEKDCFGNNLPSENIYLTGCHPLSIGYFDVKDINNGKEDQEQDEKVFVHIDANSLIDKLPGIYKNIVEDNANYNLIFDKHCSIDIGGLDIVTHHPVGNNVFPNPKLGDNDFQNPDTATKKGDKPFYISYENLLKYKPEDMGLKDFLGKCFIYDSNKKFNFGTINPEDNIFKHLFKYE
jgi:hypothetical protein